MNAKSILCAVLLGAAASASLAATYTVSVPAGFSAIANQLDTGGNTLNEVMPSVPDGTRLYKFNNTTKQFFQPATFGSTGWINGDPDPEAVRLRPGEGAFIESPSAFSLVFTGTPHTPVLPIATSSTECCLLSRQTNGAGTYDNIVGSPPPPETRLYRFNASTGSYDLYVYTDDGSGVLAWSPSVPSAKTGEAVWICCPNCSPAAPGCTPPSIVVQPADQTVMACSCVTFSVTAVGTSPLSYQWFVNGSPVPGATGTNFSICPVSLADNGKSIHVIVRNPCGEVISAIAHLMVIDDTTHPTVVSADAICNSNKVTIRFSEPVDPATAGDPSSYVLSSGSVVGVTVLADGQTVCLFTDKPFTPGTVVTLTIIGVTDLCGNEVEPTPVTIKLDCPCINITREVTRPVPGRPGEFTYGFTLQNLSTNSVKYVFLVPKTNCFSFHPDVLVLSPLLGPGQTRSNLTTSMTVSTNCGTNLCFIVATHDAELALCCSIMHCVTLGTGGAPPGPIVIRRLDDKVVLTWSGVGVLECAPTVIGPWATVPGATSPYIVMPVGAMKFFRLR